MSDYENNEAEMLTNEIHEMIANLEDDEIARVAIVSCCAFLSAHVDMGMVSNPMLNFSSLVSALAKRIGDDELESLSMFTEISIYDLVAEIKKSRELGEGA